MTRNHIKVEIEARLPRSIFNRPEVLNAFNKRRGRVQGRDEPLAADDRVLAILVRGEGRAFPPAST